LQQQQQQKQRALRARAAQRRRARWVLHAHSAGGESSSSVLSTKLAVCYYVGISANVWLLAFAFVSSRW
jgi:hypothetical protein